MGAGDGAGGGDEPAGAAGKKGGGEILDAPALGADAGEQEDGMRHELAGAGEMLGRGGAHDGSDVAKTGGPDAVAAEGVDEAGEVLPEGATVRKLEVEDVGGAGVGGADEQEDTSTGGAGAGDEGLNGVAAHEGVDGGEIGAQPAEEGLGVGGGGDVDVAALAVGDDEQPTPPRVLGDDGEHLAAGGAEALEAGELGLDGEAGGGDGVDEGAAVAEDGAGDVLRGRHHAGPERGGMGVETEDQLRLAAGDTRNECVAEEDQLSAP